MRWMFPGPFWRDPFLQLTAFHPSALLYLIGKQRKAMLGACVCRGGWCSSNPPHILSHLSQSNVLWLVTVLPRGRAQCS